MSTHRRTQEEIETAVACQLAILDGEARTLLDHVYTAAEIRDLEESQPVHRARLRELRTEAFEIGLVDGLRAEDLTAIYFHGGAAA